MNTFLFTALCLIITNVVQISCSGRGINAKEGEFKYQATVHSRDYYSTDCGAAILNEWYAVTSAACTHYFNENLEEITLYLGALNIYKPQQKRGVAKIIIHEQFNTSEKHHDIALIKTTEKIEFSANIQPVDLPERDDVFEGKLFSSGFGLRFVSSI